MAKLYKLDGIFFDLENADVMKFDCLYTTKKFSTIINEILPQYVEYLREYESDGDVMLHHIEISRIQKEVPVDAFDFVEKYTYYPNGELYVSRKYNSIYDENGGFKGRKEKNTPLKVGDTVKYISNQKILHGVIYQLPPNYEEYECMDALDDSYIVLGGLKKIPEDIEDEKYMKIHEHVEVDKVFPLNEDETKFSI